MASIDFLNKRIEGKKKEISNMEKRLQRIRKAEASGWEVNPYCYDESDLRYALQDIQRLNGELKGYQDKLQVEMQKSASRNIPIINQFLDIWEQNYIQYFSDNLNKIFQETEYTVRLLRNAQQYAYGSAEYYESLEKADSARKKLRCKKYGYYEDRVIEKFGKPYKTKVKVRDGEYEPFMHYVKGSYEESMSCVIRDAKNERDRKYDFIIEKTQAIVGQITDASSLSIGSKGDLNGYIIGTNGVASVKTIGAGGYNIQCFHFRTLINRV